MRIIIVISSLELGGAQRVAINIAEWINKNNEHKVQIISLSNTNKQPYEIRNIDFCSLKGRHIISSLRKAIYNYKPDIVLTMGVPLSVYTVPACLGFKIKHIISERNDPMRFSGKKITKIVSRFYMYFANGFVFQTKQAQKFYGRFFINRSVVIHNPLFDLEMIKKHANTAIREKVIVSVGRLNEQKNHELLIKAFRKIHELHSDYTLEIYGEGPKKEELQNLINHYNINSFVKLLGTSNSIIDRISDKSIFILSSNFEGMPNALMEAMALGLSCISTDCPCGGPNELIKSGENGILVPVNDVNSLVSAVDNLLNNPNEITRLGLNALKIRETHNADIICMQWINYFKTLIEK